MTDKNTPLIYFTFLYFVSLNINAQEKSWVHFDREFYVLGEYINYKIYNSVIRDSSEIVYVELVDSEENIVSSQKIRSQNSTAYGSLQIPFDEKEAYYRFRYYKNSDVTEKFPEGREWLIPIYDPWKRSERKEVNQYDISESNRYNDEHVKLSSPLPGNNESVLVKIDLPDLRNVPSASILKQTPHNDYFRLQQSNSSLRLDKKKNGDSDTIERNLFLKGEITDSAGNPISTNLLILNDTETGKITSVGSLNGRFNIQMSDFEGVKQFQIINLNPFNKLFPTIKSERTFSIYSDGESPVLKRTSYVEDRLRQHLIRNKISEAFSENSKDSVALEEITNTEEKAVKKGDRSYKMSKFSGLKTMGEFLDEVLVSARVLRKENEEISIRLFSPDLGERFLYAPVYEVNGHFLPESTFMKIPTSEVINVDVFLNYFSLDLNYHQNFFDRGIVSIKCTPEYFEELRDSIPSTIEGKGLFLRKNQVERSAEESSGVPDLTPYLTWVPEVSLNQSSGNYEFFFETNDLKGDFTIEIQGMSINGEKIILRKDFRVD